MGMVLAEELVRIITMVRVWVQVRIPTTLCDREQQPNLLSSDFFRWMVRVCVDIICVLVLYFYECAQHCAGTFVKQRLHIPS
jgi:hypothetical protein